MNVNLLFHMHENICFNQRWLNCFEIAFFFLILNSYVCIEGSCLFRVCNDSLQLYFKSKGLGNVSILINICFFRKKKTNNVMVIEMCHTS